MAVVTDVPTLVAPGETLRIVAGGSMVKLAELLLENAVLFDVVPLIVTLEARGDEVVSDAGTTNVTFFVDPTTVATFVDLTVTGEPFPAGGVIVTDTQVAHIVP